MKKLLTLLLALTLSLSLATAALADGRDIAALVALPVRERIGRFKYTPVEEMAAVYDDILAQIQKQTADAGRKEEF